MAPATYHHLSIDTVDIDTASRFWAAALGLEPQPRQGDVVRLVGPTPAHEVRITAVPEPKTVKNRTHLDVHTGAVADLEAIGARVLDRRPGWTVMTDPDGQEFCAFLLDDVPEYRLHDLVVDCVDALTVGTWWATVFGVPLRPGDGGDRWLEVPDTPFEGIVFVPVPEPKTAANRVRWTVRVASVDVLIEAGATLLRGEDDEIGRHLLADPEGNEFYVVDD